MPEILATPTWRASSLLTPRQRRVLTAALIAVGDDGESWAVLSAACERVEDALIALDARIRAGVDTGSAYAAMRDALEPIVDAPRDATMAVHALLSLFREDA